MRVQTVAIACFALFLSFAQVISAQSCATLVGTSTTVTSTATLVFPSLTGPVVQIITTGPPFESPINVTLTTPGFTIVSLSPLHIQFTVTDTNGFTYTADVTFGVGGTLTISRIVKTVTYSLNPPQIQVTAVMFNHKPQTLANDDGLDIRYDYQRSLRFQRPNPPPAGNLPAGNVGEWALAPANAEPALWVANKTVTIKARFTVNTNAVTSADLSAIAVGGFIPNVLTKTVNFVNGVSANPAYVEFNLSRNTDDFVNRVTDSWQWKATNLNGCGGVPVNINASGPHRLYTVLDTPTAPWYSGAPNQQPWVSALDLAIVRAGTIGIMTIPSAATQITTFLHGYYGLTYDTIRGAPRYILSNNVVTTVTYWLSGLIAKAKTVVNCYDEGGGVAILTNLLGGSAEYHFMQPFGYINTTILVGGITTNNPFFRSNSSARVIGGAPLPCVAPRTSFGNHVFDILGGKTYDATAGPHTGTENVNQYIASTIQAAGMNCAASAGNAGNVRAQATLTLK